MKQNFPRRISRSSVVLGWAIGGYLCRRGSKVFFYSTNFSASFLKLHIFYINHIMSRVPSLTCELCHRPNHLLVLNTSTARYMWFSLIFIQREALNYFAPHLTLCDTGFITVHYISFHLFFWLAKPHLINSSWVPSTHLTTLAPLLNICQGYHIFIEVGVLDCVHHFRCWWAKGLTEGSTMQLCFSLLLSRFLYRINMVKGWHYTVDVCSSLNSMKGEQPLRCKSYLLHSQKIMGANTLTYFLLFVILGTDLG